MLNLNETSRAEGTADHDALLRLFIIHSYSHILIHPLSHSRTYSAPVILPRRMGRADDVETGEQTGGHLQDGHRQIEIGDEPTDQALDVHGRERVQLQVESI